MAAEEELAVAVDGRTGWRSEDTAALFARPGATAQVRVRAMAAPTRSVRFAASIVRNGRAEHTRLAATAVEAIRWAEQVPLG